LNVFIHLSTLNLVQISLLFVALIPGNIETHLGI
jgi:hypothetical protein